MHLGVVDKFNNLQVGPTLECEALSPGCPSLEHGLLHEALHRFISVVPAQNSAHSTQLPERLCCMSCYAHEPAAYNSKPLHTEPACCA